MPTTLDLDRWGRRAHFEFFRRYERPFFNVCAPVDATAARVRSRAPGGPSFTLKVFHAALAAANAVEPFRYRLRGDGVIVHEVVHGGSTTLREDDTFAFAYFDYEAEFGRFAAGARAAIERARAGEGLGPRDEGDDLCRFSVIPWVAFTSITNARRDAPGESIPTIVFGKVHESGDRWLLPVSVEVHHALMDGLHVGRFFAALQEGLDRA
ncbi:MAG TPA: CatA-like O-acetyltransferase [Nannocystaceae bacterium]|nr:CatA-like O-acetyltransferase [Nannocystaceae bacterium]